MKGFVENIESLTLKNSDFRRVLYTAKNSQLVVMSIAAGEDIGEETHKLDQFIRFEAGKGKAVLDDVEHDVEDGSAVIVPAGTKHNIINTGKEDLKLYTVYSPPEHKDGEVHKTKAEGLLNEKHFDGKTTE